MNTHSQRRLGLESLEARRLLAVEVLVTGSGETVDLPLSQLSNVSKVDICGSGDNTVILNADWVSQSCPDGCVDIIADSGDHIEVTDTGWKFEDAQVEDGMIVREFNNGDATLRMVGPDDFTNPMNENDVNGNGEATAWDVNLIINELHAHRFSNSDGGSLVDSSAMQLDKFSFFDVSGDHKITSLDALRAMNVLGVKHTDSTVPAEGEVLPIQLLASDPVIAQRVSWYETVETLDEDEDDPTYESFGEPIAPVSVGIPLLTVTSENETDEEDSSALDKSAVDELVLDASLGDCIDPPCLG